MFKWKVYGTGSASALAIVAFGLFGYTIYQLPSEANRAVTTQLPGIVQKKADEQIPDLVESHVSTQLPRVVDEFAKSQLASIVDLKAPQILEQIVGKRTKAVEQISESMTGQYVELLKKSVKSNLEIERFQEKSKELTAELKETELETKQIKNSIQQTEKLIQDFAKTDTVKFANAVQILNESESAAKIIGELGEIRSAVQEKVDKKELARFQASIRIPSLTNDDIYRIREGLVERFASDYVSKKSHNEFFHDFSKGFKVDSFDVNVSLGGANEQADFAISEIGTTKKIEKKNYRSILCAFVIPLNGPASSCPATMLTIELEHSGFEIVLDGRVHTNPSKLKLLAKGIPDTAKTSVAKFRILVVYSDRLLSYRGGSKVLTDVGNVILNRTTRELRVVFGATNVSKFEQIVWGGQSELTAQVNRTSADAVSIAIAGNKEGEIELKQGKRAICICKLKLSEALFNKLEESKKKPYGQVRISLAEWDRMGARSIEPMVVDSRFIQIVDQWPNEITDQ